MSNVRVLGMIRVRFVCSGFDNPVQDHNLPAVPSKGDQVELPGPDGTPIPFEVMTRPLWPVHDVIPADVVLFLEHRDYRDVAGNPL